MLVMVYHYLVLLLGDSISTVEYFDPIVGRWQVAEPMSTLRSRVGIAVLRGMYATFTICGVKT